MKEKIRNDLKKAPIPNTITGIRVILGLASLGLFFGEKEVAMLITYSVASLTDWVDGAAARKLNQCTKTGASFDAISDKFLTLIGGLIGFKLGGIAIISLLAAEGLTGVITYYRKTVLKAEDMKSSLVGRIKEWPLKFTFALVMLSSITRVPKTLLMTMIGTTGVLQVATVGSYLKKAVKEKKNLEEEIIVEEEIKEIKEEELEKTTLTREKIEYLKKVKEDVQKPEKEHVYSKKML